ncbi:MAG: hypothetical protein PHU25_21220 [Deltaproteobacteria bacterium]|nr:hypothetical protein [Deltaproteobacteria bacterium]
MGRIFDAIVLVLYPVIVLVGLPFLGVRYTALVLLALMARRLVAALLADRRTSRIILIQAALVTVIVGLAAASGSSLALRFAPFVVSLTFIALFAASLAGTPIIERFARLKRKDLPPDHVVYCRGLTVVWIGVLGANSVLILFASLFCGDAMWTVLVGPVSYGFLGMVFTVEYVYRKWRFQDFDTASLVDRALRPVVGRGA